MVNCNGISIRWMKRLILIWVKELIISNRILNYLQRLGRLEIFKTFIGIMLDNRIVKVWKGIEMKWIWFKESLLFKILIAGVILNNVNNNLFNFL